MKKFYSPSFKFFLFVNIILFATIANAQTTVSAPVVNNLTYNSATAAGAIVFGVKNNNPGDVMITDVANYVQTDFTGTFTLWYHPTAVTGAPPAINTTNGWVSLATNTVTTTSAGVITLFSGVNFILPVNTVYRFAISGPPYAPFYGGVGTTPNLYSAGGVEIYVQNNPNSPGYGGAFPGPPGNTPRSFLGSITFVPNAPCIEPPSAGQAIASQPFVCQGSSVSLDLMANTIGTGQTYQWQTSPTIGGTYTNIGTSSGSPVLAISPVSTAWYRALVSCSGNPPAESQPVEVAVTAALAGGTYTIDNTLATGGLNFQSFTDAVNRLNSCGVAGPVIFDVAAGQLFTEDVPVLTATGTAANTITFRKNGAGPNPKIMPQSAGTVNMTSIGSNGDGIIVINGGDHFTFDGIDLETNPGFSGADMYEYGYFLKKATATNASKNITIKNCTITLNKAQPYSYGIYISNISGTASITVTSTGGRSENIKISNNTIFAYAGIQQRGYSSSAPYDLYDQNIEIGVDGGNTISDFGGGTQAVFVLPVFYSNNVKIANNTISGGTGTTGTVYGIYSGTATNANIDIYNNQISFEPSSTSGTIYTIYNSAGGTGTDNTVNIYNNTISNINLSSSTSGTFYGIYQIASALNANIYGNILNNITKTGTGTIYCLYNSSTAASGTVRMYNNTVTNVSGGSTMYGVYSNPVATTNVFVNNNQVGNLSSGSLYGITLTSGAATNVYQNKVYDLNSTGNVAYGIQATTGAANNTYDIFNNIIGNLNAPSGSTADGVRGISIAVSTGTTTYNVSYNTIYLNASSSGTNFGAAGIYHTASATATTGQLHLRNNIVFNSSTSNGTGRASAFRRSSTALGNYGSSSNNNLFYAGSPSPNNLIFYDGTNAFETMAAYKAHVGPIDNVSISEMLPFLNTSTGSATDYLHVDPTVPTQVESGGIAITGIDVDYDGQIRQGSVGYSGTGTSTDIGADEFEGLMADFTRPLIIHTSLTFTCSAGDRTFTADISDGGGVPTTGTLQPRVYYHKGAGGTWYSQPGTLISGDGNTGTWQFTILAADMGGITIGDDVEYYLVAQDISGNVGSSPTGVDATNVNTINTPPATLHGYGVNYSLNGTYTINSGLPTDGTNFQTFGDAVKVCITGPVVFNVQPGTYNEQLIIEPIQGASAANTITFNGNGETLFWTATNTAERAVIKFNGADYITFDSLNITANGSAATEYGYGVQLVDDADFNSIRNSTITITTTPTTASSTSFAGIVVNSSTSTAPITNGNSQCDNNVFSGNTIVGGYYGVVLSADGGNDLLINNNQVINNTIQDFYSYGVYLNGNNNALIEGNDISRPSRSGIGVFNGIYSTEKSLNLKISKNKIHNSHDGANTATTAAYGIYLTSTDATAGNENIVSNNMIYQFTNLGTQYGLYNTGSDFALYFYNSVLLDNQTPTTSTTYDTRGFYQTTLATGIEIKNNIFSITRNCVGDNHVVYFNTATTTFTSDYNDLHLATSTGAINSIAYYSATQYPDLASWQATGNDVHSINVDPLFTSPTDLHVQSGSPVDDKGIAVAAVTTDIDGESRGGAITDVGADELPLAAGIDMQAVALVSPSVSDNNCYSTETITVKIKNNSISPIDFTANPVTINLSVSGAGSGTYSATVSTGILASGADMDVTMTTPTGTIDMSAPGVYFFDAFTITPGDGNGTNDAMTQVSLTREALSVGTISATPDDFCANGGMPVLTATDLFGYSNIKWQQSTTSGSGFTDIPGGTTNPFTVPVAITQNMYYQLVATCGTSTVTSAEVAVSITNPQVLNTTPGTRCGPGVVSLSATGSAGAILNWYDVAAGGTPLFTGNNYVTPVINTTTTYYVAASDGGSNFTVGPQTNGQNTGYTLEAGLFFDATVALEIKGVYVYPVGTGQGDVVIALKDASGTDIETTTVSLTGTTAPGIKTYVALNYDVAPGTGYSLVMLSRSGGVANLVRDGSASHPGYPYTVNNVISITDGKCCPSASSSSYYYFYDWQVSTGCEGNRMPVIATVETSPDNATVLAGTNNGIQECATYNVADANYYFSSCALIAKVEPQGTAPVSGDITSCVRIDASVQTFNAQPYVQRHYDLDPVTNAANATATLTLYATQAEFDAYNAFVQTNALTYPLLPTSGSDPRTGNVRITQYHGTGTTPGNYTGTPVLIIPSSVVWNNTNGWWEISFNVNGFSGFYIHTAVGGNPLPVNLLTFSGKREGNNNVISWTTVNEQNVEGFDVERSSDGSTFNSIAFENSKAVNGNSSNALNYSLVDRNIAGEKHYYRLKQWDKNGRFNYSNVVIITRSRIDAVTMSIYPNPVKQKLNVNISSPEPDKVQLFITDFAGKLVLQRIAQVNPGSNPLQLEVGHLAGGTYTIKAVSSNGTETVVQLFVKY